VNDDLTPQEQALVISLACSLNSSPGSNWVEESGGLPDFICRVAKAVMRESGKDKSSAIAIAISRCKKWAAGGNGKAAKAVAQWEALKAKSGGSKVAASASSSVDLSAVARWFPRQG
jgi:hypothetical protein